MEFNDLKKTLETFDIIPNEKGITWARMSVLLKVITKWYGSRWSKLLYSFFTVNESEKIFSLNLTWEALQEEWEF